MISETIKIKIYLGKPHFLQNKVVKITPINIYSYSLFHPIIICLQTKTRTLLAEARVTSRV